MSEQGSVPATSAPPQRILVIDDEPQIRRFLDISLRAQGYVVELAADGGAGLAALATHGADLVILDIGLPDRDGHEVLRELRQWSQVPVIMLTVRAGESEKVAALDAGANDYVTKPFGIQELMARVRGLLRLHAAPAEALPRFDDGRLHIDLARARGASRWRTGIADAQGVRAAVAAAAQCGPRRHPAAAAARDAGARPISTTPTTCASSPASCGTSSATMRRRHATSPPSPASGCGSWPKLATVAARVDRP